MVSSEKRPPRHSADETRALLVEALLRLLETQSIDAVSVRAVAAEAGVNHGLVHRYFGSKDALLREAVTRISAQVHAGGAPGISTRTFELLRKNPVIARVVARVCLDGPHDLLELAVTPCEDVVAKVQKVLDAARIPVDGRVVNTLVIAAYLGWFAFRPLLEAYGLPKNADDEVATLARLIDAMTTS